MRSAPRSFIPILALVAVAPMLGQTSAMDVLVILKNQPQREILDQAQLSWFSSRPAQPQRKSQSDTFWASARFSPALSNRPLGLSKLRCMGGSRPWGLPRSCITA
jgi:hypothetical protein